MATPKYTRNNAWNNGGSFDNQDLLWYAKGVAKMMSRPIADPQSWWFYAAIHGELADANTEQYRSFEAAGLMLWKDIQGPPAFAITPLPSRSLTEKYWNKCEHASWFFLPWHRGYLLSLEAQLRLDIIAQGGPDNWALPYWDYFGDKGRQFKMPPAFAQQSMPDGTSNSLYVMMRYGVGEDGNIVIPTPASGLARNPAGNPNIRLVVTELALQEEKFTVDNVLESSFGGTNPQLQPDANHTGLLESNPHNAVHTYIGEQPSGVDDYSQYGLMSISWTAGLDPIFFLHHCNIDRLWASWNAAGGQNSTNSDWTNGPAIPFIMPKPLGESWTYTPKEMTSIDSLDYNYQDLTPVPEFSPLLATRLQTLSEGMGLKASFENIAEVSERKPKTAAIELLGATTKENLALEGQGLTTTVTLDKGVQEKAASSFISFADSTAQAGGEALIKARRVPLPDNVFLKLEQVTGYLENNILSVYVRPKKDANAGTLAGSVSMFGLSMASIADGNHGGKGLTFTFNITPIVDQLHLTDSFTADDLEVSIESRQVLTKAAHMKIGRISVYRQALTV